MLHKLIKLILIFSLFSTISCGETNDSNSSNIEDPKTIEFNLTANDRMQFNLETIVVKEGDLVKIYFENIGQMSKATMGHNFVVLKPDVNIASFAVKAMVAKETEYIPEDEAANILVYSKLLGPGEKTIIEFTAPTKGIYKCSCSFPGHYSSMQGNLIVR